MEPVVERLEIRAFRGIKGLVLDDLSAINILAGVNNSGKTSVLEAIKLMSTPYNVGMLMRIATSRIPISENIRKYSIVELVSSLFQRERDNCSININMDTEKNRYYYRSFGTQKEIVDSNGEISNSFHASVKVTNWKKNSDTEIQYSVINGYTGYFPVENSSKFEPIQTIFKSSVFLFGMNYYRTALQLLSASLIGESKSDFMFLLRAFDSSIEDISIINDTVFLHSKHSGTLPFFVYGTGMQKAVMLAAIIISTQGGVILVDEIDNAMNITAFQEVFRWFVAACRRFQVQAFVTTHSMEAIDSILNGQEPSDTDDIRIITLRKAPKTRRTVAKIRTGKEARSDRERFEMELRV